MISGPNLAREIAQRQFAATVVACADTENAQRLQKACHAGYFRPYTNPDVIGCELGGAVKNVIAIAVGMAVGMGLGDNTRAMLITRGLAETARLGATLGADQYTFAGLAGMGDLVATCSSPLSRNRTFGENLGRGMELAEVIAGTRQTAEGVKSSQSVLELARRTWRRDADHRGHGGGDARRPGGRQGGAPARQPFRQAGTIRGLNATSRIDGGGMRPEPGERERAS